jgi:hypothetical protein
MAAMSMLQLFAVAPSAVTLRCLRSLREWAEAIPSIGADYIVIARSTCDEAIQSLLAEPLDCLAETYIERVFATR